MILQSGFLFSHEITRLTFISNKILFIIPLNKLVINGIIWTADSLNAYVMLREGFLFVCLFSVLGRVRIPLQTCHVRLGATMVGVLSGQVQC